MSKVTRKFQVTSPKAIAERFQIQPGDEIAWRVEGDSIRIEPVGRHEQLSTEARLKLFDEATQRIRRRRWKEEAPKDRGWTREELYERARPR
jgi:AbrB family looped-hinge helix DNA binding protein